MNTIITVKNLKKNYGSFEAVKDISFDVYEGEIFGLLGPNGAGKSTTLEIIETLREKTSGSVTVDGIDLDKSPDEIKKARVARINGVAFKVFEMTDNNWLGGSQWGQCTGHFMKTSAIS